MVCHGVLVKRGTFCVLWRPSCSRLYATAAVETQLIFYQQPFFFVPAHLCQTTTSSASYRRPLGTAYVYSDTVLATTYESKVMDRNYSVIIKKKQVHQWVCLAADTSEYTPRAASARTGKCLTMHVIRENRRDAMQSTPDVHQQHAASRQYQHYSIPVTRRRLDLCRPATHVQRVRRYSTYFSDKNYTSTRDSGSKLMDNEAEYSFMYATCLVCTIVPTQLVLHPANCIY